MSEQDRQAWFRSMMQCPNCCTGKTGYKLCGFHEDGKKLLKIGEYASTPSQDSQSEEKP